MTETHPTLHVRLADDERDDPAVTEWRLRHATETFSIIHAFVEGDLDGVPVKAEDGTYTVHVPAASTLPAARQMCEHENLTIVREGKVDGNGALTAFLRRT